MANNVSWVYETTTTTGTGTVTLVAVTGRPRFSTLSTNSFVPYVIKSGDEWEEGFGTVGATNTFARTVITAKYAAGAYSANPATGITLAGTSHVYLSEVSHSIVSAIPGIPASVANERLVAPANVVSISATAFVVPSVNRLLTYRVTFASASLFDAFAIRATGAGNVDIGLYENLNTNLPGALVVGVNNTAVVSGMNFIALAAAVRLNGWYWIAINFSATAVGPYRNVIIQGLTAALDTATFKPLAYLTATQGTLPDPFGTPTGVGYGPDGSQVPGIWMRATT